MCGPCDDGPVAQDGPNEPATATRTRTRIIGRALNDAVVRAPWAWPLLRGSMRRFFDQRARGWDQRTGAGSVDHLAAFAAALMRVEPPPERALDIGTGTGAAALLIAREFPAARVRGIDISAAMVAQARAKVGLDPEGRIAFKVADASALPWDDDAFDLLTQLNTPPFFAELARVTRPGGHLIVASSHGERTPFYTSPATLAAGFARHSVSELDSGECAGGTWWIGRLKP